MNIKDCLSWRYELYLKPYMLLHENPLQALLRKFNNYKQMHVNTPICYVYADATNIGDKVSALGVKFLLGQPGVELFASRAALHSTTRTLSWLQENRPETLIVVGGGGLLQECFSPFWSLLFSMKLKFALFGVGANELSGKRSLPQNDLFRNVAHRACSIHVRDDWTKELLSFGQETPVTVGICPAVNYLTKNCDKPVASADTLLHVKHPVDIRMAGGDPDYLCTLLKTAASEIGLAYDETDHINVKVESLVQRYQRARLVVTSRLHGCIFSFALNRPFVAVNTDRKIAAFINTHVPGNPTLEVDMTKEQILEQVSRVDSYDFDARKSIVAFAIVENQTAMRRLLLNAKR